MSATSHYVYNPNPPPLPFFKYVIAGGIAGICEILCMYPLDVVKTRMQLQETRHTSTPPQYKTVLDCFTKIMKQERVRTLYRGIGAPICAEAPKRAVKFSTNEGYKKLLTIAGLPNNELKMFVAGLLAGVTEAVFNCPPELLKVRMQAKGSQYNNTLDAAKRIIREEGLRTVFRGLSAQMMRNGIWDSIYFALTFSLKKRVLPEPKSKSQEMARNFIAGVIASSVGTTFATPFDCVKSRMQSVQRPPRLLSSSASSLSSNIQVPKWNTVFGTLITIYREEGGLPACFKGLTPRLLRLAPGGGIMLVAFDFVASFLGGH